MLTGTQRIHVGRILMQYRDGLLTLVEATRAIERIVTD